jgi:methylphosphotriester-DNA--protein-cysteine methyltransferase
MNTETLAMFATGAFAANLIAVVVAIFKLGTAVGRFENIGQQQAGEMSQMKEAIKEIAGLITKSALQTERMDNMAARINRQEMIIDDIRRGEGFILPLSRAAESKFSPK